MDRGLPFVDIWCLGLLGSIGLRFEAAGLLAFHIMKILNIMNIIHIISIINFLDPRCLLAVASRLPGLVEGVGTTQRASFCWGFTTLQVSRVRASVWNVGFLSNGTVYNQTTGPRSVQQTEGIP